MPGCPEGKVENNLCTVSCCSRKRRPDTPAKASLALPFRVVLSSTRHASFHHGAGRSVISQLLRCVRIYGVPDGLQIGNVTVNYSGRIGQWLGGEFGLARFD